MSIRLFSALCVSLFLFFSTGCCIGHHDDGGGYQWWHGDNDERGEGACRRQKAHGQDQAGFHCTTIKGENGDHIRYCRPIPHGDDKDGCDVDIKGDRKTPQDTKKGNAQDNGDGQPDKKKPDDGSKDPGQGKEAPKTSDKTPRDGNGTDKPCP